MSYTKTMIIPPDKTFNYKIPQLRRDYVRTGVLADGSCFFHSYFRAFNMKYKSMPPSERKRLVRELREELAARVTVETLKELSGGEHRRLFFFEALRNILEGMHTELAPQKLVQILEVATTYTDNFYNKFVSEALADPVLAACPVGTKQQFVDKMKEAFFAANRACIEFFKNQLLTKDVGTIEIEYIARFLKCNFIFIYETERGVELYPFSTVIDQDWPYCVLLWVDETHYEIIGRKEENGVITRTFYSDDEIVMFFAQNESSD